MPQALILDAEAINALANPNQRGALFGRARAILAVAYERRALVRVPAPVLAELYRGPRFDAPINQLLKDKGILVENLTADIAKKAGHLLSHAKLSSVHAVDAFVVATALSFERAIIATGDPDDLIKLAVRHEQLTILSL